MHVHALHVHVHASRGQAVPNLIASVSALLGAPLANFEEPQLVRYRVHTACACACALLHVHVHCCMCTACTLHVHRMHTALHVHRMCTSRAPRTHRIATHVQPGQSFSWHYDALPPGPFLNNGGQRAATCLVYLNDVAEGGRTAFRDLRAGGTDADGKPPLQLEPLVRPLGPAPHPHHTHARTHTHTHTHTHTRVE